MHDSRTIGHGNVGASPRYLSCREQESAGRSKMLYTRVVRSLGRLHTAIIGQCEVRP